MVYIFHVVLIFITNAHGKIRIANTIVPLVYGRMSLLYSSLSVCPGGSHQNAAKPFGTQHHSGFCIGSFAVLDIWHTLAVQPEIRESDMPGVKSFPIPLVELNHINDELHLLFCPDFICIPVKIRHIKCQFRNGMVPILIFQYTLSLAKQDNYALVLIKFRRNLTASFQKTLIAPDSAVINPRKKFSP